MVVTRSGCERRKNVRYCVDWFASIMHKAGDGKEIFHGRVSDISLGGAAIYSDMDIYTGQPLVMLIATPLPSAKGKHSKAIAGIQCAMCKPVFSEEHRQFRTGVQFLRFHGIDKHLLADALFTLNPLPARRIQEADHLL